MKFFSLLLIFCLFSELLAELFSAIDDLKSLSENEDVMKNEYESMIEKLENIVLDLKRKVANIEKEQKLMKADSLSYVSNPLNAYLLIKRLSIDVNETSEVITEIAENFSKKTEKIKLLEDDFDGAVEGLLRLQAFYTLTSEDLVRGVIQGQKYRDDLTADEIYSLGVALMESYRYKTSLSYLNLALDKNDESLDMPQLKILEKLYQNHNATGNIEGQVQTIGKILELDPERKDLEMLKKDLELKALLDEKQEVDNIQQEEERDGRFTRLKEFRIVSNVCKGELTQTPEEISRLRCRFVSNGAFSKIGPFKVEEANLDPYIAIFYDIMSDAEIEIFKTFSKSKMSRAKVLKNLDSEAIADIRIAKLSWHCDNTHQVFQRMAKRVTEFTGLSMTSAEQWQTQNYGIGGHYDAHYDFFEEGVKALNIGTGNRIATVLFYLSDVERGGATVFPYLKIRVLPKKGAALFWYNLSTSGHREYYTRHSACPVLVGSKWVTNKWIHEQGQEFVRPCGLKPSISSKTYYKKFF